MTKVFTAQQFVDKLKWLVSLPTHYSSQYWSVFRNGKWEFDCLRSIKAILWNFSADKSKPRGGTVYKSNGVADFSCNGGLNYCTNVSKDFTKLVPGSYLCMKGTKYNHSGICLVAPTLTKRGKVFECTTGWGTGKCVISEIDTKGNRYYNGVKNIASWTQHGLLVWIDYSAQPQPVNQVKLWQAYMNEQWNCGLAIDGSFGPLCEKAATKHQLYKWVKAPVMVKWLQKRLIDLGYSCGKAGIDGSFGNDTDKAVRKFQKDRGLKVDGYVGKDTYKALVK